jgi:hypothetical protein
MTGTRKWATTPFLIYDPLFDPNPFRSEDHKLGLLRRDYRMTTSPTTTVASEPPDKPPLPVTELEKYLFDQFTADSRYGFRYDGIADFLTLLSIVSGFVVSVVLLNDWLPRNAVIVLSSVVPGASLAIIKGLNLVQRGQWHWAKARKFQTWYLRLHYGLAQPAAIAKEITEYMQSVPDFPRREAEKLDELIKAAGPPGKP